MTESTETKSGRLSGFWRACRFLGPHRRLVIVSVVCALFVGLAFTSSLGTMLPIFNILLSGQTAQQWIDEKIAQQRVDGPLAAGVNVHELADPDRRSARVAFADGRSADVPLGPVPWHLRAARKATYLLPAHPVKAVAWVLGAIVFITLLGNIVRFFQEYLSEKAAILAVNDIRRKVYDHALHVPLSYFSLKGTSDVTSRLTQDVQGLQEGFKAILGQTVQEPIKALMALGLAMLASWKLTLFMCLFGPAGAIVIRKFGSKMRRASRRALQESATMLGQVESSLGGIRVVKASVAERFERRRYRQILLDLTRQQLRMSRIHALNTPVLETINIIVLSLVVLYAAYMVLVSASLSPGTFMLVMACLVGMGESLRRVSKVNNILQHSSAAATRLFEILAVPTEKDERASGIGSGVSGSGSPTPESRQPGAANPLPLPPLQRDIVFDGVTFTYAGASAPAVDNVSLRVQRGQCVAIVGPNGSGKTTLMALLPRFYEPQAGRILIDGVDVRRRTLRSLRRRISVVTQDSVIFPGTIAHNIAYGMPRATRQQIIHAAERAFAHEFILDKPQGYDTLVGEHGAGLSGGQKQRICIARAVLRNADILILDEATSQVDAQSEHLIQQAIESLLHERTTFVIAHRFSTILSADTIAVMDRGQVVGQGSHDHLLASCEVYQRLYERQLGAAR